MRPITVSVGPLGVAGVGNSLAGSTQPVRPGPQQLTFNNGLAPTSTWNGNVSVSGNVVTVSATTSGQFSAGVLLTGLGLPPNAVITGPGPGGTWLMSPALLGPSPLAITNARTNPVATLDVPRQIQVNNTEPAGTVSFTIYGTDATGRPISETLVSTGGLIQTQQNFATVTQMVASGPTASAIFVGTVTPAISPWVMFDPWASGPNISKQVVVNGAVNYTVQVSYDDPNAPGGVTPTAMGWTNDTDATFVGATTSLSGSWPYVPLWARVVLNSGTGSLRATFIQPGVVPF